MVLLAKHIKGAYSKEDNESKVFFKTKKTVSNLWIIIFRKK